jgi:multisubunit Na+/H+ antiporter MnhE subunit
MPRARTSGSRRAGVAFWLVAWICLFVLWLLYADSLAASEVAAGLVASALAATGAEAMRRQGLVPFRPRPRWFLRAVRLPSRVAIEFGRSTRALWMALGARGRTRSRFRAVPFPAGGTGGRAAARRALAVLGGSFAPNAYVIDFDEENGLMLVHELAPSTDPDRIADIVRPAGPAR